MDTPVIYKRPVFLIKEKKIIREVQKIDRKTSLNQEKERLQAISHSVNIKMPAGRRATINLIVMHLD